jgi:hypothetical protein
MDFDANSWSELIILSEGKRQWEWKGLWRGLWITLEAWRRFWGEFELRILGLVLARNLSRFNGI